MNRPQCHKCSRTKYVKLRRVLNAGGATMIAWRCLDCNCWADNPVVWIKHDAAQDIIGSFYSLEDIPVQEDFRIACDICGKPGAQLHHFFPQTFARHAEVFNDWPQWCKFSANLCQYHHDLWHDLVTPWMPGRGNSRKIDT